MNRVIKFRAKRMDNNEWLFGSLFVDKNDLCYIKKPDGKLYFIGDKDTIGQFVNLKDKHGVEMYEGDIIRVKEYKNTALGVMTLEERELLDIEELKGDLEKEYVGAIDWEEGCFVFSSNGEYNDCFLSVLFGNMKNSDPIFDFEAIGNIHDNPELLKKWDMEVKDLMVDDIVRVNKDVCIKKGTIDLSSNNKYVQLWR